MKKLILLLLPLLFFGQRAFAQPNWGGKKEPTIKGKLTGKLLDSLSNEPVAFATVVLINPEADKEVNGTITEDDGHFKISEVPTGTYQLQISFIGYETKVLNGVSLTLQKPDLSLDDIRLSPTALMLDEVTVTEEASIVENRVDKIVYNADKDVTVAGGDASEVLRKVPLLTVDLEGNVSLRGSSNIRMLINGKPSGMFANNIADALKMIPADQIKSVEVITTPSAKYDGEGSAGIVNIITKKKKIAGFSGSVNGSLGTRQNNGVLSLSLTKGRFGINTSGSTWYSWPRDGTLEFVRENEETGGLTSRLTQDGITETSRIGFNGNLGAFYDINAYNSLSSSVRINGYGFDTDGTTDVNYSNPLLSIMEEYTRSNQAKTLNSGYDWTTDYRRTYTEPEREFTLAFQLSGNINDRDLDLQQMGNDPSLFVDETSKNEGRNLEMTMQSDYVHPFSKAVKLETGAKAVLRTINSDYNVRFRGIGQEVIDPDRTDVFHYNQDVYSGYASFTINFAEKYSLIAGMRYERTGIDGDYDFSDFTFDNSYDNWLPSIILSRKLKNFSTIKGSYNRRIQRPSLYYINPYTNDSDRRNITFGNPELSPEVVDQFEIAYNTFIKGTVINLAVYYKNTQDVITQYLEGVDSSGASVNSFRNVGEDNSLGLNFFGSTKIKKNLSLRGNFNLYSYNIDGTIDGEALSNDGILFSGFISATYSFKHGIKAEGFWFGRSPRRTIQGTVPSFDMFSFGVKKELFKKRGSLGITIIEPFRKDKSFTTELERTGLYQFSEFTIPFRSFGINFSYRFGKLDFKERKAKSAIKNDDLKGDGNNNGGGGGRNF